MFRIFATKEQVIIRVAFVIKSDNYSQNFHQFLKVKKSLDLHIRKCQVCRSSKIIIKNQKGIDDIVVYDGQQDVVNVRDIPMVNKNKLD